MLEPVRTLKTRLKSAWVHFREGNPPPLALPAPSPTCPMALEHYVRSAPSPQNALDIFQGEWSSSLPGEHATFRAGALPLFNDPRIDWAAEQLGGFHDRSVLELGPLEGGHTYMIEKHGAASVIAVEANTRAYLKCLIAKEVLGLRKSRFLCGDLMEYLRTDQTRFDVCVASGVLYHMRSPVEMLVRLAERCDRLFLWTHYYDEALVAANAPVAEKFAGRMRAEYAGYHHTLHRYEYRQALTWNGFCGGSEQYTHWMLRDEILACLKWLGFGDIRIGFDEPQFANGPSFALAALRHH